MYSLGGMYERGEGVVKDYDKARAWYQKAADAGNADAMYYLGWMDENGEGVTEDYKKAFEWYQKSLAVGSRIAREGLERVKYKLDSQKNWPR